MDSASQTAVTYGDEQQAVILDMAWELTLAAPVETVWQKLINEVDGWWAHSYKPGSTVLIEPVPGGRFWERFADGEHGAVYASVVYVDPPHVLKCMGNWAMPGIGMSSGTWKLEATAGGTLLKATGQMQGVLDTALLKQRTGGTQTLLSALRNWVERGERVVRG